MEDRSTPAVVFTGNYVWNNATVNVTVDDSVPGYYGQYHWNYNVQNDSFASGVAAFAVPLELTGMASNVASDAGWVGSPSGFMGDAALVSWQNGAQPALGIGQSANFWFTTAPTAIGITAGFVAAPGLAVTAGGTLVTAMADAPGLPQAPPPGLLVSSTAYDDIVNTDQWFTLREAVNYVNQLQNQPQKRIAFKSTLAGSTLTMDPALGQFTLSKPIFIDGPVERITIKRDATSQVKHRLFDVGIDNLVKLADLNLRDGEVTTTEGGGAVHSRGYLTVEDCTFSQNKAVGSHGGAIAAFNKSLSVTRSGFTGNSAMFGGGIYIGAQVIANISYSALTLNTALWNGNTPVGAGGGIYIDSSTTADRTIVTLYAVDVSGNTAFGQGGHRRQLPARRGGGHAAHPRRRNNGSEQPGDQHQRQGWWCVFREGRVGARWRNNRLQHRSDGAEHLPPQRDVAHDRDGDNERLRGRVRRLTGSC